MDTQKVYERIEQQITDAGREYGLPAGKLKFSLHVFKPDSAKLETVVALDIGMQEAQTRLTSSIRSFYSPSLYRYHSAAKLEKDIRAYLHQKKIAAKLAEPSAKKT